MKILGMNGKINIIGERVKSSRIKKEYSQADLAREMQKLGVMIEQKAISRTELGQRLVSDYELLAFSQALGVSVLWLLTGD